LNSGEDGGGGGTGRNRFLCTFWCPPRPTAVENVRWQCAHLNAGAFFSELSCASLLPSSRRIASDCSEESAAGAVERVDEPVDSIGRGRSREEIRFFLDESGRRL
jgi:hypothetical protein